jgi:hypothetical protein
MSVITLLTDFGTRDSYLGEVRGVLVSRAPDVSLVDITHDIAPGDVAGAAYILGRVWSRFPAGTVHLVVVDPGVGGTRNALAVLSGGHAFVAPDNGVLTPVLSRDGVRVAALPIPASAAPTFHGRDVFAPAAAALADGTELAVLGPAVEPAVRLSDVPLTVDPDRVAGQVIYIDRFGNLVTNLPAELSAERIVSVDGRVVGPLRRTFADVEQGDVVAYVGSGGTVEIAVRDRSAAGDLGARIGTPVSAGAT